jgi:hypothetical protein
MDRERFPYQEQLLWLEGDFGQGAFLTFKRAFGANMDRSNGSASHPLCTYSFQSIDREYSPSTVSLHVHLQKPLQGHGTLPIHFVSNLQKHVHRWEVLSIHFII